MARWGTWHDFLLLVGGWGILYGIRNESRTFERGAPDTAPRKRQRHTRGVRWWCDLLQMDLLEQVLNFYHHDVGKATC